MREKGIEIEWTKSGDRVIHIYRNDNYVPRSLDHMAPENKAGEQQPRVKWDGYSSDDRIT